MARSAAGVTSDSTPGSAVEPACQSAMGPDAPSWSRWLAVLVGIGAILLCAAAIEHLRAPFVLLRWYDVAGGLVLVAAFVALARSRWVAGPVSGPKFLIICVVAFVLSRLAVVAFVPTQPVSDFLCYYRLAGLMAEGEPLPPAERWLFFSWGYPLALAPWFALFGKSVLLAQLLNVAAGTVAVLLLYPLARHVGGPGVGRCAVLLFVLWPAQLLLTPVLASEHLALVLSLAYLLCVITVVDGGWKAGAAVLAGVCVGLGCAVRPALGITVPIGLLLIGFGTGARWRRLVFIGLLVAGFTGTQAGYRGLLAKVYQRTPPTVAWWNLLAGTNQEKRGMWNQEDADKFFAFPTLEESNRFARGEIYRRVTSNPIANLNLIRRKLKLLWGDNYYGVYWSTRELGNGRASAWVWSHLGRLFAWTQVYHLAALALCAFGALRFARHAHGYAATLLLMLILSGTALHAVFETQSRYSYVFSVGMLVFAACGAVGFPGHQRPEAAGRSQDPSAPTQPGAA